MPLILAESLIDLAHFQKPEIIFFLFCPLHFILTKHTRWERRREPLRSNSLVGKGQGKGFCREDKVVVVSWELHKQGSGTHSRVLVQNHSVYKKCRIILRILWLVGRSDCEGTPPVAAPGAHWVILLKAGAVKLQMKQLTGKSVAFHLENVFSLPWLHELFKTCSSLLGTAIFENQICS